MFCPQCGQERVSTETNYCSRCGFLLTGTSELLTTGGVIPRAAAPAGRSIGSPRSRGLKQGLFIFLLTFLIVPIIAIITVAQDADPYALVIAAILLAVGGLLRMAYALMFEEPAPADQIDGAMPVFLKRSARHKGLSPQQTEPVSTFAPPAPGNWRNTNDLQPARVADAKTQLLDDQEL